MKKNPKIKILSLMLPVAVLCLGQARAADPADAYSIMADMETRSVESKLNWAEAAMSGDPAASDEAMKRSDAIDALLDDGQRALMAMEDAVARGDDAAADAAMGQLIEARDMSVNAMQGDVPAGDSGEPRSVNRGGRPGNPRPNIYDVPWKSQGIRKYYEGLFGIFTDASAFGHGRGFGDRDATPE